MESLTVSSFLRKPSAPCTAEHVVTPMCCAVSAGYCLDRTAAGFPTDLIVCPIGEDVTLGHLPRPHGMWQIKAYGMPELSGNLQLLVQSHHADLAAAAAIASASGVHTSRNQPSPPLPVQRMSYFYAMVP